MSTEASGATSDIERLLSQEQDFGYALEHVQTLLAPRRRFFRLSLAIATPAALALATLPHYPFALSDGWKVTFLFVGVALLVFSVIWITEKLERTPIPAGELLTLAELTLPAALHSGLTLALQSKGELRGRDILLLEEGLLGQLTVLRGRIDVLRKLEEPAVRTFISGSFPSA